MRLQPLAEPHPNVLAIRLYTKSGEIDDAQTRVAAWIDQCIRREVHCDVYRHAVIAASTGNLDSKSRNFRNAGKRRRSVARPWCEYARSACHTSSLNAQRGQRLNHRLLNAKDKLLD